MLGARILLGIVAIHCAPDCAQSMPNIEQSADFSGAASGTALAAGEGERDGGLPMTAVCKFPILRPAGFGLAAVTLSLAAVMPAGAQDLKVSLNAPYDGSNAAFFLAEDKGYYAAEGLKVTFDPSGGSGEAVTRIGSGTYDFRLRRHQRADGVQRQESRQCRQGRLHALLSLAAVGRQLREGRHHESRPTSTARRSAAR